MKSNMIEGLNKLLSGRLYRRTYWDEPASDHSCCADKSKNVYRSQAIDKLSNGQIRGHYDRTVENNCLRIGVWVNETSAPPG